MTRLVTPLAAALLLLAPFREGGRDPLALLYLHILALLYIVAVVGDRMAGRIPAHRPGEGRAVCVLAGLILALALAAARRAAYPLAAAFDLWDLAIALGLFMAALFSGSDGASLLALRGATVASTSLQSIVALVRLLIGGSEAAGASFLNPNHLAAFLTFGLILCVAAADEARAVGRRRAIGLWLGLGGLNLLGSLALQSRGALLGMVAALTLFAAFRWRAWPRPTQWRVAAGILLATALGGALLIERFARVEDPYRYHRLRIWSASLHMLWTRPLLGFGPGMFRHEAARFNFPLEEGPIRYGRTFQTAHSGLLTVAVEDGAPAALFLMSLAVVTIAGLLRRSVGPRVAAHRGVGLALVALTVQGLVDDLQERPALTLLPALLAGTALAVAWRREESEIEGPGASKNDEATQGSRSPLPPRPGARAVVLVGAAYLFVAAILLPYLADREARAALRLGREGLQRMERAARLNPLQPEYRQALAMAALNSSLPAPERYARASLGLLEARRLKPIDDRFPLLLGRLEADVARPLFDDKSAARRATEFYREAARLAPLDPRPLLELAGWLDQNGEREEALAATAQALRLEPNFLRARILTASILLDLGRREEARGEERSLRASLLALKGYHPDSQYAADLVADDPVARERLLARLTPAGQPE
ncbi:MAG TPA: O-antigen ligase family protein [Candidatus Polarisedimenticolia bacterium]|nr:O-antigen ligase family protein [Candidatus Polarisedimenticolia bacterium]